MDGDNIQYLESGQWEDGGFPVKVFSSPTLSTGVKSQLRFDPWELGKYGRRLDGEEVSRADTDPVLIKHQIMPPATQDTTSRSESHGRFSENNFFAYISDINVQLMDWNQHEIKSAQ